MNYLSDQTARIFFLGYLLVFFYAGVTWSPVGLLGGADAKATFWVVSAVGVILSAAVVGLVAHAASRR